MHKDPVDQKWSLSFPGSDRSVVLRSQRHFYETRGERPVQIGSYVSFDSLGAALGTIFFGIVFGILAKIPFTRGMLANVRHNVLFHTKQFGGNEVLIFFFLTLQNSKIFSLGFFSDAGPTKKQIEGAGFKEVLIGRGWDEKLLEGTDKHVEAPNKQKILEVTHS